MDVEDKQKQLVDNLLLQVKEFPTLPTIYTKLSDTITNPTSSAQDVANIISQDQSSVSKILKVANSSMFGFVRKVTQIEQAVVYIGFEQIKSLVLALSVMKLFENVKEIRGLTPEQLWRYSFGVGAVSRSLAKRIGEKNIEDFFVAGIIHGIGKLLFMVAFPEMYGKLIENANQSNEFLHVYERKVLGLNHIKVGGMLAEKWNLPQTLTSTLSNYHTGFVDGRFHLQSAVIHLSTVTASMFEMGNSGSNLVPELNKQIWNYLEIPEDFFSTNFQMFYRDFQEMSSLLLSK